MVDDDLAALLRSDHRRIEQLLERAGRADPSNIRPILDSLRAALLAHREREATVVYPDVRAVLGDDLGDHVLDEHQGLDDNLHALDAETPGTSEFRAVLRSLTLDLHDHIAEEEKDILPALRAHVEDHHWRRLGHRMQQLTAQVATSNNRVGG